MNQSPVARRGLMQTQEAESLDSRAKSPDRTDRTLMLILRLSALSCFAGWTWGHLYWEGPYGVLLWQDATYNLARQLGIDWDQFVGSGVGDGWVQRWISRIGWLYLACTVFTVTAGKRSYLQMAGLVGGSGLLAVLSYAKYVESQRQLPMFVEHGGQVLAPILLVMALSLGVRHRVTVATAMVAMVATFVGHGAYAMGWWPTPANFYAMVTLILGLEYETAKTIVWCAGLLDLVVCLFIFVSPLRRAAAAYAVVWGLLTSLARPVAGMSLSLYYWGADQFMHEAVLRGPHFLIPLYLVVLWRRPPTVENRSQAKKNFNQTSMTNRQETP